MDEAAEDEARSEQQLFALCPSPVDMTMLNSVRLIVSGVDRNEKGGGREKQEKYKLKKKNKCAGWPAIANETTEAAAPVLMLDQKDGDGNHRRRSRTPGGMKRSLVRRSGRPR